MRRRNIKIGTTLLLFIVIGLILRFIILWSINGGIPGSGPTGNLLPMHIYRVTPKDGEEINNTNSDPKITGFCVDFALRAGNGMYDRTKDIQFYLDGFNITNKTTGVETLNSPPSFSSICYRDNKPLLPGWYTVKVIYKDNLDNSFHYTWRFLVTK
jgi:hypothetical protein